jgi:hypothetical protein
MHPTPHKDLIRTIIIINILLRQPLWSSGQSSWLQSRRSGFDPQRYQIFWEIVGLERGALNLVSITEELLGKKSSGSGIENREYGRRDHWSRWPRDTHYPQQLALTEPTNGGRSVGIVRSRTKAIELIILLLLFITVVFHLILIILVIYNIQKPNLLCMRGSCSTVCLQLVPAPKPSYRYCLLR